MQTIPFSAHTPAGVTRSPAVRLLLRCLFAFTLVSAVGCSKDDDNDGFRKGDDCNDDDPEAHPGAAETCDGKDNDCNDSIDEGVQGTYWLDADGDGYGDADLSATACELPDGYADVAGDCDDNSDVFHPGALETDCTDDRDYNCDGSTGYADADADGVPACEDCDDSDETRKPGSAEVCDGVDNDCDLEADDNPIDGTTWYIDYDLDGYGSDAYTLVECSRPSSLFVDNDEDCNDFTSAAKPDSTGTSEICDGIDNDCDGYTDATDDSVQDAGEYYLDTDGDTFGDDATLAIACVNLDGYVEAGGDCDDTSGAVNPDANELCNDEIDNDCDPSPICDLTLTSADSVITGASTTDGLGHAFTGLGDLNGDGAIDLLVSANSADPDGDGGREGASYLIYGPVTDILGTFSAADADVIYRGESTSDLAGTAIASLGDVDDDGVNDFGVTASTYSPTSKSKAGTLYIVSGATTPTAGDVTLDDTTTRQFYGGKAFDYLGGGLAGLGDINGDGVDDLAVGATFAEVNSFSSASGAVYIFYGGADLQGYGSALASTADVVLLGEATNDKLGSTIRGLGDINGDGADDFALGAKVASAAGSEAGVVYLGLGGTSYTASGDASQLASTIYGGTAKDYCGTAISSAGDDDGDGYIDFWVSAPGDNTTGGTGSGSIYLIRGSATVDTDTDGVAIDLAYDVQLYGSTESDGIGASLAGDGDVDGDGQPDLVVGAPGAGSDEQGLTYLIYGPFTAGAYEITPEADATFFGAAATDAAGTEVNFLGDLDGNGTNDIGTTAVNADQSATDSGSAYILLGVGL